MKSRSSALRKPDLEVEHDLALVASLKTKARIGAYLFGYGWLDLHTAVDAVERHAKRLGVATVIGHDAVQQILSDAFAPYRETAS